MAEPRVPPPPLGVQPFDSKGNFVLPWQLWFLKATGAIADGSAPANAEFLIATADPILSNPRNLGLLSSGYLSIAVALGVATPSASATIPATDLSGTIPDARLPFVYASGTYTPTLTNSVNVAASAAFSCQYLRLGSVVTVSGQVSIDPTAAGDTQLEISLPIASNFAAANELGGTAVAPVVGEAGALFASAANDRAVLEFQAVSTANNLWWFTCTYRII